MRNDQLVKALSSYDDNGSKIHPYADLNEANILRQKKELYSNEIALTASHQAWRSENLRPRPIDLSFMQSLFLSDNPYFREIKAVFIRYNSQVASILPEQYDLRPKVIDSMVRYMHTILKTEDREAQLRLLKKGYDWFMDKLDTRLKYKPQANYFEQLQKMFEGTLSSERETVSKPNMNLPSEQTKAQERHYRWKARTVHEELHTPQERLKGYKTRIINFESSRLDTSAKQTATGPYSSRVKYEKPAFPIKFKVELPEDIPTESVIQLNTAATNQAEPSELPPMPEGGVADQAADLQLGEIDDNADAEEELEEEEGKLDPRLGNYIYPKPIDHRSALIRLNYRQRVKTQDQQRILNEDNANITAVKMWARNKGRLKTELGRKLESAREFSRNRINVSLKEKTKPAVESTEKFILCGGDERDFQTQPLCLEEKIDHERVELIRRRAHRTINGQQKQYEINTVRGTSLYDKARLKTQSYSSTSKPFSKILSDYSKAKVNQETIEEVARIKNHFSKLKVNIEMSKLADALSLPQDTASKVTEGVSQVPTQLPSNPYFKVGKKKKKKKGKKAK